MRTESKEDRFLLAGTVLAVSGMLLAGCSAELPNSPLDATPDPTAFASSPPTVTGSGSTGFPGVEFMIPAYAKSLVLEFECEGGGAFTVEVGDAMALTQAPLSGFCSGRTELGWPITERTGSTLSVTVPDGVVWTAAPTFSLSPFDHDPAVTADCEAFSPVYSAFLNADTGYQFYGELDESEWSARVSGAVSDLTNLADRAESQLSTTFGALLTVVSGPALPVGSALTEETQAPISEVNRVCNTNQTPLIIAGEFGG